MNTFDRLNEQYDVLLTKYGELYHIFKTQEQQIKVCIREIAALQENLDAIYVDNIGLRNKVDELKAAKKDENPEGPWLVQKRGNMVCQICKEAALLLYFKLSDDIQGICEECKNKMEEQGDYVCMRKDKEPKKNIHDHIRNVLTKLNEDETNE